LPSITSKALADAANEASTLSPLPGMTALSNKHMEQRGVSMCGVPGGSALSGDVAGQYQPCMYQRSRLVMLQDAPCHDQKDGVGNCYTEEHRAASIPSVNVLDVTLACLLLDY
jgi:hypothetical protein